MSFNPVCIDLLSDVPSIGQPKKLAIFMSKYQYMKNQTPYFERLTPDNFREYAIRYYDNPECKSQQEFDNDLENFTLLHKSLTIYLRNPNSPAFNLRIVLNYVMTILNLFGIDASAKMLTYHFRESKEHLPAIKTFLTFLNSLPQNSYDLKRASLDRSLLKKLRELSV